ncbi:outer membrane beta-barrel protein [Flavobacterium terrigena]|uniref:Outer membrane protein n=1 Tax=Flavobacterium terrigena TaxID=402734 RepID=A0A1H6XTQ3_9FLAO|nr:outer membrane beta-barrel protein [Flavobacterium terrigena]SEJ32419.1 outer membrane protein [Flavobacterium terrigena]
MKKVLLTAVAVFSLTFVNAQEEKETTGVGFSKGNVFVSGAVGFGSSSTADVKETSFTFSPKVGFFVTENIAVGVKLGLESTKNDDGVDTIEKTNDFSAGVFGRYYFTPSSQFSVFAQLGVDMTSSKTTTDITGFPSMEGKSNGFGVAFAPGVNYFLSDNFAIEATWGMLGYNTSKPDVAGAESTDNFGLRLDMNSINFGLLYKF